MLSKKRLFVLLCLFGVELTLADTSTRPQGEGKFIPIFMSGITIMIPAPVKNDSAKAQAKRFVSAYLAQNSSLMEQITSKTMIKKLKTVDDEVKNYFKTISSYHEMFYFHDKKAMVIAISQGEEIKFYFSWNGSRWIMDEVL
jgi:hypothetical protein